MCHGLVRQAQGSGRRANSRSAKRAAAVSPAPPLPGGSRPGPHPGVARPLPACSSSGGPPCACLTSTIRRPPGKPGASQGLQGPATESGRSFSDPTALGWARGARTPHTGLQRGSTGGPAPQKQYGRAPQQAGRALLPSRPITVTMPWLSQGLSGHPCGLLQADSERQQTARLPVTSRGLCPGNQGLHRHFSEATREKDSEVPGSVLCQLIQVPGSTQSPEGLSTGTRDAHSGVRRGPCLCTRKQMGL